MAQAEISEIVPVSKEKFFATITRYEDYPKYVDGVKSVKVERKGAGQARVTYYVSMMKEVVYTLDHREDLEKGVIEWSLVESDTLKKNTGRWNIKSAGDGKTDVNYSLEVEFKIPVPGFILNRLVKGSLPSMLKNFVNQALKG